MVSQQLVSYIEQQKAAGVSESVYRAALKAQGWSDEVITAASLGPIPTPAIDMTLTPSITASDSALAAWSFWTLVAISVFHIVWLGSKNTFLVGLLRQQSQYDLGYFIFCGIILLCIVLNFLPVILAIKPWRKGNYKKQIVISIISFIICQVLLHVIFVGILGTYGAVGC